MSTYKLTYFNFYGRGEAIRFLLSYGGIKFEDIRVETAEWAEKKLTFPFGKLPILEIDGVQHSHSMAICSTLAERFNLAGSNEIEKLQITTAAFLVYDLIEITDYIFFDYREAFGNNFMKEVDKYVTEIVPAHFEKFEAIVAKNNGHFVNGKLSWADIFFASFCTYFQEVFALFNLKPEGKYVEYYQNLKELRDKVWKTDGIKDWVKNRPKLIYWK